MKKMLALLLVLGLASMASATVIDVVTVGVGSMGHSGTINDKLMPSETIELAIVLNFNDGPVFDGYGLSSVDLDLHTAGAGSLTAPGFDYYGMWITELRRNSAITWGPGSDWQNLTRMIGVAANGLPGPAELVGGIIFHCMVLVKYWLT
jgi:hypothetical protein